jgi:hypothetical protein
LSPAHPDPYWDSGPFGIAGWSSPVARQAHNLKVVGSNPAPATRYKNSPSLGLFLYLVAGAVLEHRAFNRVHILLL